MAAELDHVLICSSAGAEAEANALIAFGLSEGTPNVHPGQGTACRRFFFRNSYLELVWVDNAAEAQSAMIQPTHLWERWTGRSNHSCPFGLGFRSSSHGGKDIPFPAWDYRPPYLPDSLSLQVATNAAVLTEPMLFYLPIHRRPESVPSSQRQPLEHAAGLREITHLELFSPHASRPSLALQAVSKVDVVRVRPGDRFLLEIGFDGEVQDQVTDFHPILPLVFRW